MAIPKEILDELLKDYQKPEDLLGQNGLLQQLSKALIERVLDTEMTHHLGYEKHSPEPAIPATASRARLSKESKARSRLKSRGTVTESSIRSSSRSDRLDSTASTTKSSRSTRVG
jgi:transposase-like protein